MRGRSNPPCYALRAFRIPLPPLAISLVGAVRYAHIRRLRSQAPADMKACSVPAPPARLASRRRPIRTVPANQWITDLPMSAAICYLHVTMKKPILHKMLGDPGPGDTTWFTECQNPFERDVIVRQMSYKAMNWPDLPMLASHRGSPHHYPHILPPGSERLAYFDGFADEALAYMKHADIEVHSEALNLKSSQAACINFLYPLRHDLGLAPLVLRDILPNVATVTGIEFEYTGQDETDRANQPCTVWLGEPSSGKRGQNRTSIDAAIFWTDTNNATRISLVEWKYTERNFGTCSAHQKAKPDVKARCRALDVTRDPASDCILAGPGRHYDRRYWEHMAAAGISLTKLGAVEGCPFQGPFYQLMRQFLVAQYLRDQRAADHVDVIALEFEGNTALRAVPPQLRPLCSQEGDTVIDAWNAILDDVPPLRRVTAEELVAGYDSADGVDSAWREYIRARYGL